MLLLKEAENLKEAKSKGFKSKGFDLFITYFSTHIFCKNYVDLLRLHFWMLPVTFIPNLYFIPNIAMGSESNFVDSMYTLAGCDWPHTD